ncbi:hypothetical protein HYS49_03205 [Candidatus Woesearchaeota archaeon]|nr:hypothetical protein [Candidatus Woesearchaeota archaeon]
MQHQRRLPAFAAALCFSLGAMYVLSGSPEKIPTSKQHPQTIVGSINRRTEDVLFQEENIPILEEIIQEEIGFLNTPESSQSLGDFSEQEVVEHFRTDIQPLFDEFLETSNYDFPRIEVGMGAAFSKAVEQPLSAFLMAVGGVFGIGGAMLSIGFGIKALRGLLEEKERRSNGWVVHLLMAGCCAFLGYGAGMSAYNRVVSNANSFSPQGNTLNLSYIPYRFEEPETLALIFGHELTHAVQYQHRDVVAPSAYLLEGHASGVEQHLRRELYEATGNTNFIYEAGRMRLGELLSTYTDICEYFSVEPRLFADDLQLPSNDRYHSYGTALFALREQQWGDRIYAGFLDGDYCPIFYSPDEKACERAEEPETVPK